MRSAWLPMRVTSSIVTHHSIPLVLTTKVRIKFASLSHFFLREIILIRPQVNQAEIVMGPGIRRIELNDLLKMTNGFTEFVLSPQ